MAGIQDNPTIGHWYRLYTQPTGPEASIEPSIASLGIPYRFQHIMGAKYILDFALPKLKVAIEIDGPSHDTQKGRDADARKEAYLEKLGWRVVRISNYNASFKPKDSLNAVLEKLGLPYRATV